MAYDDKLKKPTDTEKFLAKARERFRDCLQRNSEIISEIVDDQKFRHGQQWELSTTTERQQDKRPLHTINKINNFVNNVVNDAASNRPAIKIRAVDDLTDPITADVITGLVRHITSVGDSRTAFDGAFSDAATGGLGYFRVVTDYTDDSSFDQEIRVERVENPCAVVFPIHQIKAPDFSDAPYCFIRTSISREEYDERFPKYAGDYASWDDRADGDAQDWMHDKDIFLCEYFVVESEPKTLYLMPADEMHPATWTTTEKPPEGMEPLQEREVNERSVSWFLIDGFHILDQRKFPAKRIPVIPITGQEMIVEGDKKFVSMVRFLREPQRMLNYWYTKFTEVVSNAPMAPWLIAETQIEGYESVWAEANRPQAYLPYKPADHMGQPLPPPSRISPPEVGSAILQGINIASEMMKEVSGIYDASLGMTSNERSGKAINARVNQGRLATYHFMANYHRAMRSLGKLLMEMIPEVYDTARTIRILGEDQTDKVVLVNQMHSDANNPNRIYDMKVGKYDVVVDVGASYDTKRMEMVDILMSLFQTNPQMSGLFMDILARSLDVPNSDEISKRAKRFVMQTMPGIIADDESGTPEEQLHQQLAQITQDVQRLMAQKQMDEQEKAQMRDMITALNTTLRSRESETTAKVQIAALKAETEAHKAHVDLLKERMRQDHGDTKHAAELALKLHEKHGVVATREPTGRDMTTPTATAVQPTGGIPEETQEEV